MTIAKLGKYRFQYEEENLSYESNLPEITHEDAKEILFKTKELFDEIGLKIYLTYGTLLGAVRDKDFIAGDLDVDVYVKDEYSLFRNLDYLRSCGLMLIRVRKHDTYSFRYKNNPNCYIDIYIMRKTYTPWGFYCYELCKTMVPKRMLQDGKIEFLGEMFDCPANPKELLEFWYTETWNRPIDKFEKQYRYTVASHYYYQKIKDVKSVVKFLIGWKYWKHYVKHGTSL